MNTDMKQGLEMTLLEEASLEVGLVPRLNEMAGENAAWEEQAHREAAERARQAKAAARQTAGYD